MSLTHEQYDQLLFNYCESILDGMDMDTLLEFAYEQLEMNLRSACDSGAALVDEISRFNDESEVAAMLEDVGANPADFDIHNHLDDELTEEQIQFLRDVVKPDNT